MVYGFMCILAQPHPFRHDQAQWANGSLEKLLLLCHDNTDSDFKARFSKKYLTRFMISYIRLIYMCLCFPYHSNLFDKCLISLKNNPQNQIIGLIFRPIFRIIKVYGICKK